MSIDMPWINSHVLAAEYKRRGEFHGWQLRIDASGCLDAPEIIPAGSMVPKWFGYDDDEFIPVQRIVFR